MTGKPKLTPDETVALAEMRDDPELDTNMRALVARLEGVSHLALRSMCAGFILGSTESYEDALHTLDRILALVKHGGFDEQEPS